MSQRIKIKALLESEQTDIEVLVKGWVRTFRNNQFIALNDGSTNGNLQVVVDFENTDPALLKRITTGAAISASGILVASLGKGQKVELKASVIEVLGDCDPETYPIQPKKHSLEFLRENAHLRFRTNTFGAIFRVRNSLAFAIHQFFQERGFVYLHTPIITASDAEGAGETFHVTNLDLHNPPFISPIFDNALSIYYDKLLKHIEENEFSNILNEVEMKLLQIDSKEIFTIFGKNKIRFFDLICADESQLRQLVSHQDLFVSATTSIKKLYLKVSKSNFFVRQEVREKANHPKKVTNYLPKWFHENIIKNLKSDPKLLRVHLYNDSPFLALSFYNIRWVIEKLRVSPSRHVDYSKDFFGKATNLTVSGQLEGELGAMALSDIYTFGPTFRAENSNTTRHLAEFWMIEPEMAFYDLNDNMDLAEALLKYVIRYALEKNVEDIEFLTQRLLDEEKQKPQQDRSDMTLIEKLQFCLDNDFERLTYTEAIDILKESTPNKKKKFQYLVEGWGTDLQSEHERYLVEKHFKKPVILTDYPKQIKAFYMRQNETDANGNETVRAMDILFPGIGEIVGGSQREERLDKLEQRMDEMGIPKEELWWYLDTRRFGACPHAGFGLGFERLVLFVTGMGNIRDVIPFPRFPKNAEF
ncbi:MAG TPA: asparagine--tRNA ligase [Mucilaginibacter sp.]|jgi:aspartyl/asparaginyl-tRNA synthetase|nr:asparagine--tRNA ligase [Mucilaginibacter sp.]